MTGITVEGLGPLVDLARALGLLDDHDQLDASWFSDPGGHVGRMLRVQSQRDALLRAIDGLLNENGAPLTDAAGRRWAKLIAHDGVALFLVVESAGGTTELGVGARLTYDDPEATATVLVPLLAIPASGPAVVVLGQAAGKVEVTAEVLFGGGPPAPGEPGLAGLHVAAVVATDGSAPELAITLRGLQLPGESTPADIGLDGAPAELGDQAIRVLLGLVQRSVAAAAGPVSELLALVGITGDAQVPALPVAELFAQGAPAWRSWLDGLLADSQAVDAWLGHLASLVGHGATVVPPASPGLPHRVGWTLANGLSLAATVTIARSAGGAPQVELGVEAVMEVAGPPVASLEASATLVRITLGAAPAAVGLPALSASGRIGKRTIAGDPDLLVNVTNPATLKVGSFRAGVALDAARRVSFVLAAHDVTVGSDPKYAVLDLTKAETLAQVAGSAVNTVAGAVLDQLGPAKDAVTTLLGVSAPPGQAAWPVPLVPVASLLSDPVNAVLSYHRRVLATNLAGYPAVLDPLRGLLRLPAVDVAISGTGDEGTPWRLALADGVALLAWRAGEDLTLGLEASHDVVDLGGGCPTVKLALAADLVRVSLAGGGGHVLPGVRASLTLGARGGVPLRLGDADAALVADRAGLELRWSPGSAPAAAVVLPGLAAEVEGEDVPFALPALDAAGRLTGDVPWRALELLAGQVLQRLELPWAAAALDLVGWRAGEASDPGHLALDRLVADPVAALRAWLSARVADGSLGRLASALATSLFGNVPLGRGDAAGPLAIPLGAAAAGALRRAELLLASGALPVDPARFAPGDLVAFAADAAAGLAAPSADRVAAALADAALASPLLSDLLADRPELAGGLAALAARWTDSDGLVPAAAAALDGARVLELPRVGFADLCGLAPSALGVSVDVGTVFVVGPLGPSSWTGAPDAKVLDLSAAGLAPEAFDLSRLGAEDGPWCLRLPSRADAVSAPGQDGAAAVAARLRRAVEAVAARLQAAVPADPPGPHDVPAQMTLVAHGAAGHAALAVADTPGVGALVTVATPFGGLSLDVLEAQPAAGALQLLSALQPPEGPATAAAELGRALLAPLLAASDAASPLLDLQPPAAAPAPPSSLDVTCVRGRFDAGEVSRAISGLVLEGLDAARAALADAAPADAGGSWSGLAGGALGVGLGVTKDTAAAPGELRVTASLHLTGELLGGGAGHPGLRARVEVGRVGGWLAGGPDPARPAGVLRTPSLRRAALELDLWLDGTAAARLVLHEASALGVSRPRWVIAQDGSGDPLLPEARILVGRLAASLGPLPATGPVRQLADLLAALGLADPSQPVATGAAFGLSVEGVRRLLVDPAGLLVDAASAASAPRLASALAALLEAPPPAASAPGAIALTLDGVTFTVDLAARTLRAAAAAFPLASGAALDAAVELRADRTLRVELGLALGAAGAPGGRPVLAITADTVAGATPLSAELRWEGNAGLPSRVTLAPAFDAGGLERLLVASVPAQALWAGITFLRTLQPGAVALVDEVLTALGLLVPDAAGAAPRVRVPLGLLTDPGGWLRSAAVMGDGGAGVDPARLSVFVDALAGLSGLAQPAPGALTLPYGLQLTAGASGGRPALTLSAAAPVANTGLRLGGSLGLLLPAAGQPVAPAAELLLGLPGAGPLASAGRLSLSVGPSGVSARLVLPDSGVDLPLLPKGPGLAQLGAAAGAAVTYALPLVLDAITDLPAGHAARPAAVALAALGDALSLRQAGRFSAAELRTLAGQPAAELARRLSANLHGALDALAQVLAPALPAGWSLARSGDELVFHVAAAGGVTVELRLTVPGGLPAGSLAGARLTASVAGIHPFAGAALSGGFTVDTSGLADGHAAFTVDPASAIRVGPVALAPLAEVAFGLAPAGGARIAAGLAVDAARSLRGVLHLSAPAGFAVEATGGSVAEVAALLVVPPAVDLALSTAEVQQLLTDVKLGAKSLKQLLAGVVFDAGGAFDPGILDVHQLFSRLLNLARNVAELTPALPIAPLVLKLEARPQDPTTTFYGITLSLPAGQRFALVQGDVQVDLEVDDSWVTGPAATSGLSLELLKVTTPPGGSPQIAPWFGLSVRGVGVRVSKADGPLLDEYLVIDSVAVHGLLTVGLAGVTDAGGQLELGNLHLELGGGGDGGNKVAGGVMKDAATGDQKPRPRFSPALAVQSHGGAAPEVRLSAGEGDGPWWVTLQRGFGPVYIEQVGFGVTKQGQQIIAAEVLVDGKVSMFGLTVAVEGLGLGATWPHPPQNTPLYDPSAWRIDLQGLGVAADEGGIQLAGALRKGQGAKPDYLGMISLRFSVYGITAYGGYGVVTDAQGDYTSFFLFGALNAPIGGVPAFFVTGIGAGVGVNRLLLLPKDLNEFPRYPFLQALDRNAPMVDPEYALDALQAYFPPQRGAFWFAAGLSFNSFSLVDGIAVIAVAIGDGLDINLLGLARAGLPNPSAALVQIELALLARFSTRDGVLWIQGQLTDNSFLLTRDCRLTGGFAFVTWFKGDKAGEFVITLGGYHPSFKRDGYPEVPRLGFVWTVSGILVIKGESYFALTSEAIMAGTRFEASLTLGPLWAYLRMGADGIVYFDPFRFDVTADAELGAGITIDVDLLFGHVRITIDVHLSAQVELQGPEFRGKASIDLDVTSATIAFGDWSDRSTTVLDWPGFEGKYLRPGGAAVLTATTGKGTVQQSGEASKKAPTGAADDPFLVVPEFSLTVTTVAATTAIAIQGGDTLAGPAAAVAIGPMQVGAVTSTLGLSLVDSHGAQQLAVLDKESATGQFPKGVWGPQPQSEPKPVPSGEMIEALNGVTFTASPTLAPASVEIASHQVEIGPRLPLPFLAEAAARAQRAADVAAAAQVVAAAPSGVQATLAQARGWLVGGAQGSALAPIAAATFARARSAPPQLVPLTYRMAADPAPAVNVPQAPAAGPRPGPDRRPQPLRLDALLAGGAKAPVARSTFTVGDRGAGRPRIVPRSLAEVEARRDPRTAARLVRRAPGAGARRGTAVASGFAPASGRAGSGVELRRQAGQAPWRAERLDALTRALRADGLELLSGDLALFTCGDGVHDAGPRRPALVVSGDLPVRVVALDVGGEVLLDAVVSTGDVLADATVTRGPLLLPAHAERVVAVGGAGPVAGLAGWHAGTLLAQLSTQRLLGPGCLVRSTALRTRRGVVPVSAAFVAGADAAAGFGVVSTRLPATTRAAAVILEAADRVDDARADALDLGLEGASRATGADGAPLPPHVVLAGGRTALLYDLVPDAEAAAVEVTVASGEHLHLSGVLGASGTAAALAEALQRRDLGTLLAPLVSVPEGQARLAWRAPGKVKPGVAEAAPRTRGAGKAPRRAARKATRKARR